MPTAQDITDSVMNCIKSLVHGQDIWQILSPYDRYVPFRPTNAREFHKGIVLADYLDRQS